MEVISKFKLSQAIHIACQWSGIKIRYSPLHLLSYYTNKEWINGYYDAQKKEIVLVYGKDTCISQDTLIHEFIHFIDALLGLPKSLADAEYVVFRTMMNCLGESAATYFLANNHKGAFGSYHPQDLDWRINLCTKIIKNLYHSYTNNKLVKKNWHSILANTYEIVS